MSKVISGYVNLYKCFTRIGATMNTNNISIKNRFIIVTIITLALLTGLGFFMITMISNLSEVTEQIINHPLEVSNAAYYANIEVLRMDRDLNELVSLEEDYEINIVADKISVSEANVYVALDIIAYDILGDEGQSLQQEARKLFDDWKPIRSKIIASIKEGDQENALSIIRNEGSNHIEDLERKLVELNQYARKKL